MKNSEAIQLARLLKSARTKASLSTRDLEARSGVTASNVVRLEQGAIANPRPETLKALADVLGLDLADVYAAAGYVQPTGLPSFSPYLRSRYNDLPKAAQRELENSFKQISRKYGYVAEGPSPGEDES